MVVIEGIKGAAMLLLAGAVVQFIVTESMKEVHKFMAWIR
jgi:hypothetical protein